MLALPAAAEVRALVGATLLDGTGSPAIEDSVVIVDGERIAAVGRRGSVAIPGGAEVVPLDGMTLLPGLVDTQVRLSELGHASRVRWQEAYLPIADRVVMPAAAALLLAAGVTTARDVGSPLEAAVGVRDRIASQRIPGPTLTVLDDLESPWRGRIDTLVLLHRVPKPGEPDKEVEAVEIEGRGKEL
ncbi:MAG: hypothetical protein WCJ30_17570, partial [Deltaproteobacteria bacterium]